MSHHEFLTSVNLSIADSYSREKKEKVPVYHFVYGSQLYGTLFGVFARFNIKRVTKGKSSFYQISRMTLQLLNYQGALNIGFAKNNDAYMYDAKEKQFYFCVIGGSKRYTKPFKFPKPIKLIEGESIPLVFNRLLLPLPGFGPKGHDKHDSTTPLDTPVPDTEFFDTEYHFRSGEEWYNSVLRPGMLGYLKPDRPRRSLPNTKRLSVLFPSLRCHQSNVRLYV
ncbi:MAG TPA: hypothetical protein VEB86_13735 [Chryseosolibacter sp.]|nr:hypothetical protein [Chryseosolibacter sp.]